MVGIGKLEQAQKSAYAADARRVIVHAARAHQADLCFLTLQLCPRPNSLHVSLFWCDGQLPTLCLAVRMMRCVSWTNGNR